MSSATAEAATLSTVVVEATRIESPGLSASGTNDYAITSDDIADMPAGNNTVLTDVLAQAPGVGIDQNQQIHIRDTEGPQFQYQINGVLVPLDINTNPPFLSMINPQFVKQLDLLDGVLPARYSYATGGVVDIQTKDGCSRPAAMPPSRRPARDVAAERACAAARASSSYYVSGLYSQGETAFSPATPGPSPIHDYTNQGQGFGFFAYALDPTTRLSLMLSAAASDNQLPNVAGLLRRLHWPAPTFPRRHQLLPQFPRLFGHPSLKVRRDRILPARLHIPYISDFYKPDDAGELITKASPRGIARGR